MRRMISNIEFVNTPIEAGNTAYAGSPVVKAEVARNGTTVYIYFEGIFINKNGRGHTWIDSTTGRASSVENWRSNENHEMELILTDTTITLPIEKAQMLPVSYQEVIESETAHNNAKIYETKVLYKIIMTKPILTYINDTYGITAEDLATKLQKISFLRYHDNFAVSLNWN